MNLTLIGIGLVALVLGTLAYRRIWTRWIVPARPGHYGYSVGFAFVFLGFAAIIMSATDTPFADDSTVLTVILLTLGVLSMLTFAMALFWLPRFLLPGWFRTLKGLE